MMYSGWDIVDTAGLVDVPIARHSDYNRKFIRSMFSKNVNPSLHILMVVGRELQRLKRMLNGQGILKFQVIQCPKRNCTLEITFEEICSFIRKDLLILKVVGPLMGNVHLSQVKVTSPKVAPGGALFIEQRWSIEEKRSEDILAIFALTQNDQVVSSGAFQPGYRWYDMSEWDTDETVVGKFPMPIPKGHENRTYELWITVLDQASGDVLVSG